MQTDEFIVSEADFTIVISNNTFKNNQIEGAIRFEVMGGRQPKVGYICTIERNKDWTEEGLEKDLIMRCNCIDVELAARVYVFPDDTCTNCQTHFVSEIVPTMKHNLNKKKFI